MNRETYMELYRKINQWSGVLRIALENLQGEVTENGQTSIDALDMVSESVSNVLTLLDNTRFPEGGDNNEA